MIRINALRMFRREFFKGLRDGLSTEQSSSRALEIVKKDVNDQLDKEVHLSEIDKMEKWANILDVLMEWSILIENLPLDNSKMLPKAVTEPDGTDHLPSL